jgi:hypothetical protein
MKPFRKLMAPAGTNSNRPAQKHGAPVRRLARLPLVGPMAAAVGEVKPGERRALKVEGVVTGVGTRGQKEEATLVIDKVTRVKS